MSDPNFANVTLLAINDSQANGTTAFLDQSPIARTITTVGNVQYDTSQFPTGLTSSGAWDGSGDTLTMAANLNMALAYLGTAWTVELFCRYNGLSGTRVLIDLRGLDGEGLILFSNGSNLFFFEAGGFRITGSMPSNTTWTHVAATNDVSNNMKLWLAGTQTGATYTGSITNFATSRPCRIGQSTDGSASFNGHLAAVRVTSGVCRYTGTFTPPSLPFDTPAPGGPSPHFNRRHLTGGLISMRERMERLASGILAPRPGLILPRGC